MQQLLQRRPRAARAQEVSRLCGMEFRGAQSWPRVPLWFDTVSRAINRSVAPFDNVKRSRACCKVRSHVHRMSSDSRTPRHSATSQHVTAIPSSRAGCTCPIKVCCWGERGIIWQRGAAVLSAAMSCCTVPENAATMLVSLAKWAGTRFCRAGEAAASSRQPVPE